MNNKWMTPSGQQAASSPAMIWPNGMLQKDNDPNALHGDH